MQSDPRFSIQKVGELRSASMMAPPPPSAQAKLHFSTIPVYSGPSCSQPAWVSEVCAHRQSFHQFGFQVAHEHGDALSFFAFGFALQNPVVLGLVKLMPVPLAMRGPGNWHDIQDAFEETWVHNFEVMTSKCIFSTEHLEGVGECRVSVIPLLRCLEGGRLVSACRAVPLRTFLDGLPPGQNHRALELRHQGLQSPLLGKRSLLLRTLGCWITWTSCDRGPRGNRLEQTMGLMSDLSSMRRPSEMRLWQLLMLSSLSWQNCDSRWQGLRQMSLSSESRHWVASPHYDSEE